MNLKICLVVLLFLGCDAEERFPGSSPLSWLRNRVFGSRVNEERFINRLATATQSLVTLMNDPIILGELNRYYGMLLQNPEVSEIVDSVRPPRKKPSTQLTSSESADEPSTTTTWTTSTPSSLTTDEPESSKTTTTTDNPTTTVRPVSAAAGGEDTSKQTDNGHVNEVNGVKYRFYFDPKLVVRPPETARARVRRHLNLVRLNDVDNCVSFLICEMSRYPLRYGPLGVKVDRFFRYPMWDTGSSAAHYAAVARHGRRHGGCRGHVSSCRHPIGPRIRHHYRFRYGH
ncbi:hypothetical protein HPB50_015874 [Hyalomma asiaticum]|uniref:Uncharacterized protein n=1 Tax=Hyalomma asiaticum TaxID=266040 RepID=A0ACB7RXN2_HYAAI|nr:hypothetical protein HPB50_015874 [Hyalomma asiaticum]